MILKDFLARIGFKADTTGLDQIGGKLDAIKNRLNILVGIEAIKGLYSLATQFSHVGEEIEIAALAAGLSVEKFQKLAFVAQMNGVSQEELSHSLTRLSRRLYDAGHGSEESMKAFTKFGFTSDQIKGFKTSEQALLAISDKIKSTEDPMKRSAIVSELLSRNSARMTKFMLNGADAIKKQSEEAKRYILTETQVTALSQLNNAVQKGEAVFKNFFASIAANFAPAMELMINKFLDFYAGYKDLIDINLENWVVMVAGWAGSATAIFMNVADALVSVAKAFNMEKELIAFTARIMSLGAVIGMIHLLGVEVTIVAAGLALWAAVVHDSNEWMSPTKRAERAAGAEGNWWADKIFNATAGGIGSLLNVGGPPHSTQTIGGSQYHFNGDLVLPPGTPTEKIPSLIGEGYEDFISRRDAQTSSPAQIHY